MLVGRSPSRSPGNRPRHVRIVAVDGASYYARRSARDPDWRAAQIATAMEGDRRRREEDPDAFLAARGEVTRAYRHPLPTP